MKQYARILDDKVILIETLPDDAPPPSMPPYTYVEITPLDSIHIGDTWDGTTLHAANEWWMFVGRFKARLGADAIAIGASTDPACVAVGRLLEGQKYVDLQGAEVAALLDVLIAANQPTAWAYAPGSGPMTPAKKAAILTTPVPIDQRWRPGL